ncbi:hypothetical protein C1T28_21235, partial [Bacillus subtilis]
MFGSAAGLAWTHALLLAAGLGFWEAGSRARARPAAPAAGTGSGFRPAGAARPGNWPRQPAAIGRRASGCPSRARHRV